MDYSLQSNRKDMEGFSLPERDRQFRYINRKVTEFQKSGNPVLSVDTNKRELTVNFRNAGSTYRPKDKPLEVNTYDFGYLRDGVTIPYRAYDVNGNEGFVSVVITDDTAEFAVETLRWWWKRYGGRAYSGSTGQFIRADGRGKQQPPTWMDVSSAAALRQDRHSSHSLPLSAWHQQVEQNWTKAVFIHTHELAGKAAGNLPNSRQSDRWDKQTEAA